MKASFFLDLKGKASHYQLFGTPISSYSIQLFYTFPSTALRKARKLPNKNRNYLEIRQIDPVAEKLQNKSSYELVLGRNFHHWLERQCVPLHCLNICLPEEK